MKPRNSAVERSLYRITFPNGKVYIGIARWPRSRFMAHLANAKKGVNLPIHRAIRKHGAEAIVMEVLAVGKAEYIAELEARAITAFGARGKGGYNVAIGGDVAA